MVAAVEERAAAEDRRSDPPGLSALGRRFESSFAGQVVISVVVALLIMIGVGWNLPDSQLKQSLIPTLRPIAAAVGMQANWQMYAPDPISGLETVQVRVRMADGAQRVWTWQPSDKIVGPFAWYRWQKLKERIIREPSGRAGLAHWVVREVTSPAERPVHVAILFRSQPLPPPGGNGRPMPVRVETLYSESLGGRP
jgi:hypothetical protein